jgi:hypothetical protein
MNFNEQPSGIVGANSPMIYQFYDANFAAQLISNTKLKYLFGLEPTRFQRHPWQLSNVIPILLQVAEHLSTFTK